MIWGSSLAETTATGTAGYWARRNMRPEKPWTPGILRSSSTRSTSLSRSRRSRHGIERARLVELDALEGAAQRLLQGGAKQWMIIDDDDPIAWHQGPFSLLLSQIELASSCFFSRNLSLHPEKAKACRMNALGPLYPEIEPYRTGRLKVSDLHEIYFEECGSPGGKPVVVLHGGPGGGIAPFLRRFPQSQGLSHHPVRPARLRKIDALRRTQGEYDLGSRRRHGALARNARASSAGRCWAAHGDRRWRLPMRETIPSE